MSNYVATLLLNKDPIFEELNETEFDQYFNDPEYTSRLGQAESKNDVKKLLNVFKLERLISGTL